MTARKIPELLKITARELRQKLTPAEKVLWKELRTKKLAGKKFVRQYPTYVFTENSGLDRFVIPDFSCKKSKLIIELDGNIHDIEEVYVLDQEKEKLLQENGYKIIRFKNDEVLKNLESVLQKIKKEIS